MDPLLLRMLAIADKIRNPCESYRGLTGNDSRYYGLTPLRNCGHFSWYQNDNFIVLTLDKAYTTYLSHDVIMLNYSVLFIICQNTKYFCNVYFHISSFFCLHNSPCFSAIAYVIFCMLRPLFISHPVFTYSYYYGH